MPETAVRMPKHVVIQPSILYFGTPVVLITTRNEDGTANISPMSSAWALGNRVLLGLGNESHGTLNLRREREAVLNLPSGEMWSRVELIAPTTGSSPVPESKIARGYRHLADKFPLAGFTELPSETVNVPRIAECPLQLEVAVTSFLSDGVSSDAVGDPDEPAPHTIAEVEVRRVHAHEDIVLPGSDHIDTEKWKPLLYVFRHYFSTGADLGSNFRAET